MGSELEIAHSNDSEMKSFNDQEKRKGHLILIGQREAKVQKLRAISIINVEEPHQKNGQVGHVWEKVGEEVLDRKFRPKPSSLILNYSIFKESKAV